MTITYEYKCRACGTISQALQSIKDEPLTLCTICGEEALERQISTGRAVIFKGEGFYVNDYSKLDKTKKKEENETKRQSSESED